MSKEFKEISKQVYKDISSISSMEQILGRRDTLALNFIETALREAYERGVDAAANVCKNAQSADPLPHSVLLSEKDSTKLPAVSIKKALKNMVIIP